METSGSLVQASYASSGADEPLSPKAVSHVKPGFLCDLCNFASTSSEVVERHVQSNPIEGIHLERGSVWGYGTPNYVIVVMRKPSFDVYHSLIYRVFEFEYDGSSGLFQKAKGIKAQTDFDSGVWEYMTPRLRELTEPQFEEVKIDLTQEREQEFPFSSKDNRTVYSELENMRAFCSGPDFSLIRGVKGESFPK
ncbi:hypothetical protein HYU14_05485 [Candidatus Woesearchaeota archaeon]|nr:hypothetical protein [Candidatus Woesearchaeota archaeon]